MKTKALTLVPLLALLLAAPPAGAQGLFARSSTYLRGTSVPAGTDTRTYMPLYEQVELRTANLGLEGLSINTSFWAMVDILDVQEEQRGSGDLNTLFVNYRVPEEGLLGALHGLELTLGRQLVAFGPTVLEQVDGGKAHYVHSSGLELGLFGGAPTGVRFRFHPWPLDNDDYGYTPSWLLGGRIGYVNLGFVSGGLTYVHRRFDNLVADNDLGLDLTVSPLSWLDISGMATLSLEALRPKEGRGTVAVRPLRALTLAAGYRYSSPDLWIPRTSIFAVFSEETFHEAFIDARWRATRKITVEGGYGRRFYGGAGLDDDATAAEDDDELLGANRASLRGTYRFLQGARAVAEVERVESTDNASNRLRLASSLPLHLLGRTFHVIVDLDFMILDETIRDARYSLVGGGYLQVPILDNLQVLAGGSGGFTPLMDSMGSFNVRLTWEIDLFTTEGGVRVKRGRMM